MIENKKDTRAIPRGIYCHGELIEELNKDGSKKRFPTYKAPNRCPYWKNISERKGFCEYLGLGDGDILPEHFNGLGEPYKLWLLWDEVKCCDVNMGEENE